MGVTSFTGVFLWQLGRRLDKKQGRLSLAFLPDIVYNARDMDFYAMEVVLRIVLLVSIIVFLSLMNVVKKHSMKRFPRQGRTFSVPFPALSRHSFS